MYERKSLFAFGGAYPMVLRDSPGLSAQSGKGLQTIWASGYWTLFGHVQSKYFTCCTVSLALAQFVIYVFFCFLSKILLPFLTFSLVLWKTGDWQHTENLRCCLMLRNLLHPVSLASPWLCLMNLPIRYASSLMLL